MMDVVTLGMANAAAKKNHAPRLESARRRPTNINLIPAPIAAVVPTTSLTKASGVSAISIVNGGTGYAQFDKVTLTGGTFASAAVGIVTAVSGGVITNIGVDKPGVYSVQPSNPVSQASSTGAGTGATFNLTFNGGVASSISSATLVSGNSPLLRFTGGGPVTSYSGYYGSAVRNDTASLWEWVTDATTLDIVIGGSNTKAALYVNGQRIDVNGVSTDASGAQYIYTLDWGGNPVPRTYKLFNVNSALNRVAIPNTAKLWAPTEPRRPLAYGLGDSYMFGTQATTVADAAFDYMCQFLGLEALPDGIGGKGWNSASPDDPTTRVTNKLTALTYKPEYVFLDLGYNDAGGNMTTLATSFDSTVAAIRSIVPTAKIIAFGPATPLGGTANLTLVKNAISGRCTALGIPFIDVENWVDNSNKSVYTDADNTHPKPIGHAYLGARKAQAVATYL
jgi:hypothetical protein